ncbi:MAG: uroporphyrinogen-III C-methyltransferase [Candidatus Thermoplasmatota archaeon]|nr:uroporphyrinogen-III C-methyltransferase [Candidatus Thermoplasmatota archaeon]MCL5889113.1 uroporphyrinogen-III C-methyltransferase [Candidatus Thermoplasmatota archaeon]
MYGKVYFVGAGPGDPELLTIKAMKILKSCDVVIHDSLVSQELLSMMPEGTEIVPIRETPRQKGMNINEIGSLLVKYAKAGKNVVRLKSGDPLIFSRIGEEIQFLDNEGIEYSIIPGISSAIYSAAASKTVITDRRFSSSFAVVTGHESKEKDFSSVRWETLSKAADTIIVLMGSSNMADYCKRLRDTGLDKRTPLVIVSNGSRKDEKIIKTTLENAINSEPGEYGELSTVIINVASLNTKGINHLSPKGRQDISADSLQLMFSGNNRKEG